jgi:hypothetical protein
MPRIYPLCVHALYYVWKFVRNLGWGGGGGGGTETDVRARVRRVEAMVRGVRKAEGRGAVLKRHEKAMVLSTLNKVTQPKYGSMYFN